MIINSRGETELAGPEASAPTSSINRTACPACSAIAPTLRIVERMILTGGATPQGLAARSIPVLRCTVCPLETVGVFDEDGRADFHPVAK